MMITDPYKYALMHAQQRVGRLTEDGCKVFLGVTALDSSFGDSKIEIRDQLKNLFGNQAIVSAEDMRFFAYAGKPLSLIALVHAFKHAVSQANYLCILPDLTLSPHIMSIFQFLDHPGLIGAVYFFMQEHGEAEGIQKIAHIMEKIQVSKRIPIHHDWWHIFTAGSICMPHSIIKNLQPCAASF